ncbi:troponin I, slow skeletal muscle isoform 2-T2 [Menidia menidia]
MLKSLMVARAKEQLEQEVLVKDEEKQSYLAEKAPPLSTTSLSVAQLQIKDLSIKVLDLRGKFKRPNLRRVRVSADAILRSLLGSKHKVSMDLRANLKSVKKDDTEKKRPVEDSDWRKNVEAMSGMEGRKKMFDAAKGSAQ